MFGMQGLPDLAFCGIGGWLGKMSGAEQIPSCFIGRRPRLCQQTLTELTNPLADQIILATRGLTAHAFQ
ncbi:hypothetical protein CKO41_12725 [Thiococcus pfennigii]|nr:hypothetical protein [Thiococcus pfennigii]